MKILLMGEYSNVHATLADGLRKLGHQVTVVSMVTLEELSTRFQHGSTSRKAGRNLTFTEVIHNCA